jgi:hypothetical protein
MYVGIQYYDYEFPLLASWNYFAGTPMEAPLDGCITRVANKDTREAKNYTEHIREYN